jgi:hypothetical protein
VRFTVELNFISIPKGFRKVQIGITKLDKHSKTTESFLHFHLVMEKGFTGKLIVSTPEGNLIEMSHRHCLLWNVGGNVLIAI